LRVEQKKRTGIFSHRPYDEAGVFGRQTGKTTGGVAKISALGILPALGGKKVGNQPNGPHFPGPKPTSVILAIRGETELSSNGGEKERARH